MQNICKFCGTEFEPPQTNKSRKTCSPKCSKDLQKKTFGKPPHEKHGFAREGKVEHLHGIWRGALKRCYCKTDNAYESYGKRGIYMCDEWRTNYVSFRNWALANGYEKKLTIDRVDNDGPYSPDNCQFVTRKMQARNRRNSIFIEYLGKKQTLAAWAEKLNIPYSTLNARMFRLNWPLEKALKLPS